MQVNAICADCGKPLGGFVLSGKDHTVAVHPCRCDRWISVQERLPEEYAAVLVTDGKVVAVACHGKFYSGSPRCAAWDPEGVELKNPDRDEETAVIGLAFEPTHWMPLPDPPAPFNEAEHPDPEVQP